MANYELGKKGLQYFTIKDKMLEELNGVKKLIIIAKKDVKNLL